MNGTVDVFGTRFQNPVLLAAGTAGFARELIGLIDVTTLGGIVTKAVTPEPRQGAPPPRVAEFGGGMLNAIGLANPGLAHVRDHELPWLASNLGLAHVILNVAGESVGEYCAVVEGLREANGFVAFEINASCPNTDQGGIEFGSSPGALGELVSALRPLTSRPLIVKLSPAVPDRLEEIARAAADAGADGFTCVNTLPGVSYREDGAPRLGRGAGGVSGPGLKPIALLALERVRRATDLPVIGVGGIRSVDDAREFLAAGASLIAVGTSALADPRIPARLVAGLRRADG